MFTKEELEKAGRGGKVARVRIMEEVNALTERMGGLMNQTEPVSEWGKRIEARMEWMEKHCHSTLPDCTETGDAHLPKWRREVAKPMSVTENDQPKSGEAWLHTKHTIIRGKHFVTINDVLGDEYSIQINPSDLTTDVVSGNVLRETQRIDANTINAQAIEIDRLRTVPGAIEVLKEHGATFPGIFCGHQVITIPKKEGE